MVPVDILSRDASFFYAIYECLTTTLGKVALASRKTIDTYLSLGLAQVWCVNFVSKSMESVADLLGLPPKWISGRRWYHSAMLVRSFAMHEDRIFAMVSKRMMGQ